MASIGGIDVAAPSARKAFSDVVPYEKIFNQNLLKSLAESQINPEIGRSRFSAMGNLNKNLAQSGGYRMGTASAARKDLSDQYERQRKEQVTSFMDNLNNNLTDYYNKMSESYYKNPSAFVAPTLPSMDDFIKQNPGLADAYNRATSAGPSQPYYNDPTYGIDSDRITFGGPQTVALNNPYGQFPGSVLSDSYNPARGGLTNPWGSIGPVNKLPNFSPNIQPRIGGMMRF